MGNAVRRVCLWALFVLLAWPAAAQTLEIGAARPPSALTAAELLHRPGLRHADLSGGALDLGTDIPIVPLAALVPLSALATGLSFRAHDGFVATLAPDAFAAARAAGAEPWIAIETAPWKHRRNGDDRGPFALVWIGPGAADVPRERWVDSLVAVAPLSGRALPPATGALAAAGRAVFATDCAPCHRLLGAGDGDLGPDLGRPLNATRYLTAEGFHRIVRDPRAVRTWPGQRMEGFPATALPDSEVDAIWAYLASLPGR